jgi:hypothetical protein
VLDVPSISIFGLFIILLFFAHGLGNLVGSGIEREHGSSRI